MVNQENKRLSIAEKAVLAAGLILLSAFTALPKADQAVKYLARVMAKKHPVSVVTPKHRDTVPAAKRLVLSTPAEQPAENVVVDEPDTTIRIVSVLYNKTNSDTANSAMSVKDVKGNIYDMVVADNKLTSLRINSVKVDDNKLAGYEYLVSTINRQLSAKR